MASPLTVDGDLSADELQPVPRPAAPRKRKVRERVSLGHLFMIAAGLLAFVLVVSLLQDRRVTTTVLVADVEILPGTNITPALVSEVELPTDSELLDAVATPSMIAGGAVTASQRIAAGDPVTTTALSPASALSGLRAMSFPIDQVDAVGGDIAAGDRVDVISVTGTAASYVAVDLEVLDTQRPEGRTGALSAGTLSNYYVTVSVDDQTALELALALEASRVMVLRSTGAEPVPPEGRQLIDPAGGVPAGGASTSG